MARSDDAHGGPDFFVHGVKDDPESSSIFYDPQRDSGVKTAGPAKTGSDSAAEKQYPSIPNFELVKLEEEQQPAPPATTTIPPGPRGPITAEALPDLGVIVLSANSREDLERARRADRVHPAARGRGGNPDPDHGAEVRRRHERGQHADGALPGRGRNPRRQCPHPHGSGARFRRRRSAGPAGGDGAARASRPRCPGHNASWCGPRCSRNARSGGADGRATVWFRRAHCAASGQRHLVGRTPIPCRGRRQRDPAARRPELARGRDAPVPAQEGKRGALGGYSHGLLSVALPD